MKEYESVYSGFVYSDPKTNWSSDEEVRKSLVFASFPEGKPIPSGGMPIISDGKNAYIDTSDSHYMIYGASGFKKSICAFMPLICILASASENMIVTDPKGELYRRTANFLKKKGYKVKVLNFRDYNGEGYNPLAYPTKLYKAGEIDKAATVSANLVAALAQRQTESSKTDPFWPETAKAFNNGILPFMYSSYPDSDAVNFISLADYYTNRTASNLQEHICQGFGVTNAAIQNLRTVLSEPDKTLMSTLATCSSFIQPFIQNDKLARMLSRSTFELEELSKEKTALYIITDDSSAICDPIVGILISQIQNLLIDKAYHSKGGKLKIRVNFLLDEFCSFPVPDICTALATHRSRNIRYFLCVQSIDLLEKRYPNYKNMITNCAASLFLGSTEMELLNMISTRCGTTEITQSNHEEPLISVPELMTLKKDWYSKEAIYLNLATGIRYCTTLPSIEKYKAFCSCGEAVLPDINHPSVHFYSFIDLMRDISDGKANKPFFPNKESHAEVPTDRKRTTRRNKKDKSDDSISDRERMRRLEIRFDELFGTLDDENEEDN